MTSKADDAQTREAFDPHARYIGPNGLAYRSFFTYLCGEEEADDRANGCIRRYLAQGRSEAFCRCFREGYDDHLDRIGGPGAPDREAIATFHAEDVATWREREAEQAAQGRRRGSEESLFPRGTAASTDHNHRIGLGLYRAYQAQDAEHAYAHGAGFARATAEHGDQHES